MHLRAIDYVLCLQMLSFLPFQGNRLERARRNASSLASRSRRNDAQRGSATSAPRKRRDSSELHNDATRSAAPPASAAQGPLLRADRTASPSSAAPPTAVNTAQVVCVQ